MPKLLIVPSLLSANQEKLDQEVKEIEKYCDRVQLDVMDGKFVPVKAQTVEDLKKIKSKIPAEIHLMANDPIAWADDFIKAKAEMIIFHIEVDQDINEIINYLRSKKVKIGIAVKPKTPLEKVLPYVDNIDMILLMTVEPGYSGQKFMPEVLPKVKQLRKLKPNLDIEVDGGLNKDTIKEAVKAGANVIVAASAIFSQKDRVKAIKELREAAA